MFTYFYINPLLAACSAKSSILSRSRHCLRHSIHTLIERIYYIAISRMHMRHTAEKEDGEISLFGAIIVEE